MNDSQFLYQVMLRVNDARAKHATAPLWVLLQEVAQLQRECAAPGGNRERMREEAVDVACMALRIATETVSSSASAHSMPGHGAVR